MTALGNENIKAVKARTRAAAAGLSLLLGLAPLAPGFMPLPAALASAHEQKDAQPKHPRKTKSSKKSRSNHAGSAGSLTGLDAATLDLVNVGNWKDANQRLATLVQSQSQVGTDHAWLAFSYLFLGNCDALDALAKQAPLPASATSSGASAATAPTPATAGDAYSIVVHAYAAACHNKLADADALLSKVASDFQNDCAYNFARAAIAGKEGKSALAADYCQRCVAAAPDFAWGFRTLGYLQQRWLKEPDKADISYMAAVKIQPDFPEAREALVDLRLAKNDYDGACDVARGAIEADPNNALNYYRLAQIYVCQWRLNEALQQLNKAIELDASVAKFYTSLATIKRLQGGLARYPGLLNDAIADQQKAVELSKDKPFDLVELASMNIAAGNFNRAANNLQDALKLDSDNQSAHDKLVVLLNQEKRYDDLVAEYRRFCQKKPKDANALLGLARALAADGKKEEALKEFVAAANMDQTNPEPHRQAGALKLANKDYTGAIREYTDALNINPSNVPDLIALGCAYGANGDYPQAEAAFVTALALQQLTQPAGPASADRIMLIRSLAALLLAEGRYSEAASQYETVYASTHDLPSALADNFSLWQAKALRDLSNASAQGLIEAFGKLPPNQQDQERTALLDTLVESGKVDLALPLVENALSSTGLSKADSQTLRLEQAKAFLAKADLSKAQEVVSKLLSETGLSDSDRSDLCVTYARILASKGDLNGAEMQARQAQDAYSKNYMAFVELGRICLKRNDAKAALSAAKRALELNPYCTRAYLLEGDAQVSLGNIKEASVSFRHAAELYPGLLEAHKSLLETLRKLSLKDEAKREEEQIAQMEKQK